jgi:hypothetical protein
LELLHVEDATIEILQQPSDLDEQSIAAGKRLKSRRPVFNFEEMGIPNGALLESTDHDGRIVTVTGARRVIFDGVETSLTCATRQIMAVNYNVSPGSHWLYEGRLLSDIYDETYHSAD